MDSSKINISQKSLERKHGVLQSMVQVRKVAQSLAMRSREPMVMAREILEHLWATINLSRKHSTG